MKKRGEERRRAGEKRSSGARLDYTKNYGSSLSEEEIMQACGRAVKTGRNRNDWRLLIGVPMPRYGAIIIVSRRFRNIAVLGSRFFPCFLRFSLPPPAALPFPSSSSSRILFSSSSSSSLSFSSSSSSSFLLHPLGRLARNIALRRAII